MSRVMRSLRTPNPKSTTIIWNEAELRAFISHMVENVRKGLKTNSMFIKIGWENICKGLEAEFKRPFGKEQLRNKMNKLRKEYNSFRRLLETRFRWDANARTTIVEDSVCKSAIQGNKDWVKYRRNGLTWWPELLEIFFDSTTREERGFSQSTVVTPSSTNLANDNDDFQEIDPDDSDGSSSTPEISAPPKW
ncbi:uncharacterized protein LOC122061699 [Macadamia integrifolia]|uniref:uncharacterized protein LOC122061699 n=1 Tax=Macadamia integrifolia TaxID=60698 RepID=UPI001C52D54A|nr:uncharacterized protein LOC122061699 [Macadamia integrifolia]